ncbi:MAG: Hsp20/alpha crystallin family protein [Nitrospirae bacterium]|nr:MAG: Hsp20/alpha crystallin family protein [Nitrospirota bacterium]
MHSLLKGMFFYEASSEWPSIDLYETEEDLVFEIDLPGINPDDLNIRTYEDLLVIEGIRTEDINEARIKYLCMERRVKDFRRVMNMPVSVNTMGGKAAYKHGVLTVRFPKLKGRITEVKIEKEKI